MPSILLTTFLNEVSAAEDKDERWGALSVRSSWLLQHPEIVVELAQLISAMENADELPVSLSAMESVLDSARIDAENRGTRGPAVSTLRGLDRGIGVRTHGGKADSP